MAVKFTRDSAGVERFLKSPAVAARIGALAEQVAGNVRAQRNTDVVTRSYTTDRAAAVVVITDKRGRLWQVRDGILTRAAAASGLEVRQR